MKGAGYSSGPHTKIIFITFSIVIASILIDTSIVKVSVYLGGLHRSSQDIVIYGILHLIYGIAQYLLKFIIIKEYFKTRPMMLIYKSVFILEHVLLGILAISIIQMIFTSGYNSIILKLCSR